MNIQKLMKQARQMQEKMERELADLKVESSVGGGMLKVTMSGTKEVLGVRIDPEVIDPEDPGMLQDLIVAAVNDAGRKVDEAMREKVGGLGLGIPGL
jgi:DNA-binding YbaB/EbfC family protein